MNNLAKKIILVSSIFTVLHGCNSSNKTESPTVIEPPILMESPPLIAEAILPLDFTLPLSSLDNKPNTLIGATLNDERGDFAILDEEGLLLYLSPEGVITGETKVQSSALLTGIEYIGSNNYVVSTSDSKILIYNEETLESSVLTQLDFEVNAVAYDERSGSTIVVEGGSPSKIISISTSGLLSESIISSDIPENSITGLTFSDDKLLIASISDSSNESFIISTGMTGEIFTVFSIDSNTTSGLILLDPEAPEILTTNSDTNQTITLFAAPTPASVASNDILNLNLLSELEFNQPSGLDLTPDSLELYYITDFGEIRKGTYSGENELLFEIDIQQGSFEAITYIASNNTLALMMSDDSVEESYIVTYDLQGNQLSIFTIPVTNTSHKFESIDYNPKTGNYMAVTASEGRKVLYEITPNGVNTTDLSTDYDHFVIAGIALSQDSSKLYLITEEWEDESEVLNAGLLIKIDLSNNTEVERYSAAIYVGNKIEGIKNPSDIAIDEMNNSIFITSDIDDSILYEFESF